VGMNSHSGLKANSGQVKMVFTGFPYRNDF
jgi:hypothetical protein